MDLELGLVKAEEGQHPNHNVSSASPLHGFSAEVVRKGLRIAELNLETQTAARSSRFAEKKLLVATTMSRGGESPIFDVQEREWMTLGE